MSVELVIFKELTVINTVRLSAVSNTFPSFLLHSLIQDLFLFCTKVYRQFRAIINNSTALQYQIGCYTARIVDGLSNPDERLARLRRWTAAWKTCAVGLHGTVTTIPKVGDTVDCDGAALLQIDDDDDDLAISVARQGCSRRDLDAGEL